MNPKQPFTPDGRRHRLASFIIPGGLTALWIAACAAAPAPVSVRRDEGSAKHHDEQAASATRQAERHDSAYDPAATVEQQRCRPIPEDTAGVGVADVGGACWTSVSNPTDHYRAEATAHRKHAAEHRAASVSLRDAETRACTGIRAYDRDNSPFDHAADITGVEPLVEPGGTKQAPGPRTAGATIAFRAVPGMTIAWMQHVVDCHLARNATFAGAMTHAPNCPLVPKGVEARVAAAPGGFSIAIRSSDDDIAHDVLQRAKRSRASR